MRTPAAPILASLAWLIGTPAAAQGLATGRYDCTLASQGACDERPGGICVGARIRRGPPNVFLTLDFDQGRAVLNRIEGRIVRDAGTGTFIEWDDLALLGRPSLVMNELNGRFVAGLRFEGSTADFLCRPARRPADR